MQFFPRLSFITFLLLQTSPSWALPACDSLSEFASENTERFKKLKSEPELMTQETRERALNEAVDLICSAQFDDRPSCPKESVKALVLVAQQAHNQLEVGTPRQLEELTEERSKKKTVRYTTQITLGEDQAIYLQLKKRKILPDGKTEITQDKIVEDGEGSLKKAAIVFRFYQGHWSEAVKLVPKDPNLLLNPQGKARWEREIEVSRLIYAKRRIDPTLAAGLPIIYWVSPSGVYQARYEGSLFELFHEEDEWKSFRVHERMGVILQAALGLKNFHSLEDGSDVHEDIKMESYLYRFGTLPNRQRCIEIVLSDFDLSLKASALLREGQLHPNSGTLKYFDPSKWYRFADWNPFSPSLPELNYDPKVKGVNWYGDTNAEKITRAQAGDTYSLGLLSAITIFGIQDRFWTHVMSDQNDPQTRGQKTHSPLARARQIQIHMNEYLASRRYESILELLRVTLENNPTQRINLPQFLEAVTQWLKPTTMPIVSESLRQQAKFPCSAYLSVQNQFKVGNYAVCQDDINPLNYHLLYGADRFSTMNPGLQDSTSQQNIVSKDLPQGIKLEDIQNEIEYLGLLGITKTAFLLNIRKE